ncbi:MAG: hypothetical protein HY232_06710 [Acidobacteria bacterium]|nr:hypothetical protein [Acidobacteriota bacterium]
MMDEYSTIDDIALALLYLTTFGSGNASAWDEMDRAIMRRLFAKGYLRKPRGKAPALALTKRGVARAQTVCQQHLRLPSSTVRTPASDAATEALPWPTINRSLAILKPKPPLLEWLRTLTDGNVPGTLAELQQDCTAILIPAFDSNEEGQSFVETLYEPLFEMELAEWDRRVDLWPPQRTLALFREWFEVEIHSIVVDVLDAAIEKEDY